MTITKKVTALNLNVAVPRSSKDTLAGLAHLPRMIDKARAHAALQMMKLKADQPQWRWVVLGLWGCHRDDYALVQHATNRLADDTRARARLRAGCAGLAWPIVRVP